MDSYLAEFDEPTGYVDFARFGPPGRAVLATSADLLRRAARPGPATVDDLIAEDGRARAAVARLARTRPDRVVLLPNTSLGLVQAAFATTGRVLVPATDFPANTYPWARAGQAGLVEVDWLAGPATPAGIAAALTPGTTAVTVSAVDFRTGYRLDLAAVREVVGDRLLVVDGIQGFGAVDAAWEAADVLVAGGQKWLRAGWGTGFGVLSDAALDRMRPLVSSWAGATEPMVFDNRVHEPDQSAAGWKLTHLSPIAAGALAAALELVEGVGVAAVEAAIAERLGELADAARSAGGRVLAQGGGILTVAATDTRRAAETLRREGITATVRPGHIRLSPHASTTAATVAAVGGALRRLQAVL